MQTLSDGVKTPAIRRYATRLRLRHQVRHIYTRGNGIMRAVIPAKQCKLRGAWPCCKINGRFSHHRTPFRLSQFALSFENKRNAPRIVNPVQQMPSQRRLFARLRQTGVGPILRAFIRPKPQSRRLATAHEQSRLPPQQPLQCSCQTYQSILRRLQQPAVPLPVHCRACHAQSRHPKPAHN